MNLHIVIQAVADKRSAVKGCRLAALLDPFQPQQAPLPLVLLVAAVAAWRRCVICSSPTRLPAVDTVTMTATMRVTTMNKSFTLAVISRA